MSPEIWGRCAWNFIHFVTLGYQDNPTISDKQNYYQFINGLQYILPCKKCQQNLSKHLEIFPLKYKDLENKNSLVKWGIDLHNIVNYYLGKPMLDYQTALDEINKLAYPDKKPDYLFIILGLLVIIILVFFIYQIFKKN